MSLGFEVEINVEVRYADPLAERTYFHAVYKGVTLFRTRRMPGVSAVIETGNTGMSSTVELVSHVDKNPYVESPIWRRQVKQLASLGKALATCQDESVAHFVATTEDTQFDRGLTQDDIDERLGPLERSFWETYLCCCLAPTDSRVTSIRDAVLRSGGYMFASDGAVQVNFSSNLTYMGTRLQAKQHPFAELVDDDHRAEHDLVEALTRAESLNNLFDGLNVDIEVLAYVYLVLHRIVCEQSKDLTKNRFLFLHRFDFAEVRNLLDRDQQRQLANVDWEPLLLLATDRRRAKALTVDDIFSRAARMHHRNLDDLGITNTIGEFLAAVLRDDYGRIPRKALSAYILRVADSTVPATVEGADNLVFEGRLPDWTALAKVNLETTSSAHDVGKLLRAGLTALGEIVVDYDCAPGQRRRRSSMDRPLDERRILVNLDSDQDSEPEGLLLPQSRELLVLDKI